MLQITVNVAGLKQMGVAIERFAEDIKDFRALWPFVIDELGAITERQFDTRGRGQWAPLSSRYARWKATHYPGRPLLVRTGRLRDEVTGQHGKAWIVSRNQITLRPSVRYWRYHQTGTHTMPARPIVDLQSSDKVRLTKIGQRWLVETAEKRGLRSYGGTR